MNSLENIAYLVESDIDKESLIVIVQRDFKCDRIRAIELIIQSLIVLHSKAHNLIKTVNINLYEYDVLLQKCLRNN